jgi:effector-binding domain-containing protein
MSVMNSSYDIVEVEPQDYLAVRSIVDLGDKDAISKAMGASFQEVFGLLGRRGVRPASPPFALYHSYSDASVDMECGVMVPGHEEGEGRVISGRTPSCSAMKGTHIGPYEQLVDTYMKMHAWADENGHTLEQQMWEYYLTDPNVEKDPSKWVTEIYWPIR